MRRTLRLLAVNLVFLLIGAIVIELGALLIHVRPGTIDPSLGGGPNGLRQTYPHGYFQVDAARGFDITPNMKPKRFTFAEGEYSIWSNKYGCYDKNESFDGDYVLLLGDSFTWGYAPYETKWATRLEEALHYPIAKCGVVHTGQRHQLLKGKDVVAAVGHLPKLVVVAYFWNDPHDDFLFPEATVVDGWMMDQAFYDKGGIKKLSVPEIQAKMARIREKNKAEAHSVWSWVQRRSVLLAAVHRAVGGAAGSGSDVVGIGDPAEVEAVDRAPNRAAIQAVKAWTDSVGVPLFFVLITRRESKDDYAALRPFLEQQKIDYFDLDGPLKARPDFRSLYWKYDPHWTPEGNGVVAEILGAEMKRRFGALLTPSAPAPSGSATAHP